MGARITKQKRPKWNGKFGKKADKLKTFRVGYSVHGSVDIKAMNEICARNVVHCLCDSDIMKDANMEIRYCDDVTGEE